MAEMSAMMSCWRDNSFDDPPCHKEIDAFINCSAQVVCYFLHDILPNRYNGNAFLFHGKQWNLRY